MEDYKIDIMIDSGPNARTVQIKLNPFTLIGATTRSGLLTSPLRALFGINSRLNYYDSKVLTGIVQRSSDILNVTIKDEAAYEVARRSRGTPRIANALLRRVRDFAQIKGTGAIDEQITDIALEALNVDKYGLDEMDNRILLAIIDKFKGGPVGLTTIATAIGENAGTLEEVYEPFLIQEGFLIRTQRGRKATEKPATEPKATTTKSTPSTPEKDEDSKALAAAEKGAEPKGASSQDKYSVLKKALDDKTAELKAMSGSTDMDKRKALTAEKYRIELAIEKLKKVK
jgi:Holliday junction resolvasome RuvABC ATP-dependent DNA helicase subunit